MGKNENKGEVITVQQSIQNDAQALFNKAMAYNVDGVENKEGKDGSLTPKKVYNFINPIGNRTTLTTYDAEIIQSTEKIGLAIHGKKVLNFAICREMAKLDTKEKLDAMGFSSIRDYGKALFDFAPVTAGQYARIGRVFIDDDYKIKSDILPQGLQKSHLVEMLAYLDDDDDISGIEQLYLDGNLTDGMSTKAMRTVLRDWQNGTLAIETTANDKGEVENNDETKPEKQGSKTEAKSSNTSAPSENSTDFDLQASVATIMHKCNEIRTLFDEINAHEFKVGGFDKPIETIVALASTLINA